MARWGRGRRNHQQWLEGIIGIFGAAPPSTGTISLDTITEAGTVFTLTPSGSQAAHTMPTVVIEMAASNPSEGDVWVDVTANVTGGVTITRGRSDQYSGLVPGSCSFALKNIDGSFTPGASDQPTIGRKVRVSYVYDTVTYRRFTGYIDTISQRWQGAPDESSYTEIRATDVLSRMSTRKLRNSATAAYRAWSPLPILYYPFDDGFPFNDESPENNPSLKGALWQDSGNGDATLGGIDPIDYADDGIPGYPNEPFARITGGGKAGWGGPQDVYYAAGAEGWISLWVRVPITAASGLGVIRLRLGSSSTQEAWALKIVLSGGRFVASDEYALTTLTSTTAWDDDWHHVMFASTRVNDTTAAQYLWVDGNLEASNTAVTLTNAYAWTAATQLRLIVGNDQVDDGLSTLLSGVDYAHVSAWITETHSTSLIDAESLYEIGARGLRTKDTSSARIDRALDWMNFPSGDRDLDPGLTVLSDGGIGGKSVFDVIQDAVTAEVGNAFVKGDGTFAFRARDHRWNDQTIQATVDYFDPNMTWTVDTSSFVSRASVAMGNGSAVTRINRATEEANGVSEVTIDVPVMDANMADGIARWLLYRKQNPRPRLSTIRVDLMANPSVDSVSSLLSVDLDDLIQLTPLPDNVYTDTASLWVEQISETLAVGQWTLELVTSPFVDAGPFWTLDQSQLDTTTILGF